MIQFYTAPAGTPGTTDRTPTVKMTIIEAGDIGIGDTNPGMKIDVKDGGNCYMRLQSTYSGGGSTGNTQLQLNRSSSSQNSLIKYQSGLSGSIVDDWFAGCKGNVDYYIWNGASSTTNLMVQQSTGNVGIGTTSPTSILHTVASGTKTATYTGNYLSNTATSSTNYVDKYGAKIESTGSWTGLLAVNYALKANASGCTNYNYAVRADANDGVITIGYESYSSTGSAGTFLGGWHSNYGSHAVLEGWDYSYNYGGRAYIGNQTTAAGRANNYGYVAELQSQGATYNALTNYAFAAYGHNALSNYGFYASVGDDAGNTSNTNYGVYALAGSANYTCTNAVGVYGKAIKGTTSNYGIYGVGGSACANNTCADAAGYFSGDVAVSGTLYQTSDAFLKDNIQPLLNAKNILNQLNPCTYTFKTLSYPQLHLSGATINYGLIADSVELILPELVKHFTEMAFKDTSGTELTAAVEYKALNYQAFIPILIQGFKEHEQEISNLSAQVAALQNGNKAAPSLSNDKQLEVKLTDHNTIILNQNDPNPFKENTTITFNIPSDVKNAQILFYNSKGNVISTVDINERGTGSLLVYGSDLTSGIYTYTLLIDGSVHETKKMMKVK